MEARPERVWSVITNGPGLVDLNAGIKAFEGDIADGGKIRLVSDIAPNRVFKLRVRVVRPGREMAWIGGMPLGLFRGVRRFVLTDAGEGTGFHMREAFSGPMAGLIWKSMPDLQPSFDRLAEAIKQKAEELDR